MLERPMQVVPKTLLIKHDFFGQLILDFAEERVKSKTS